MATSRACYGAGAATRICTTCCSRPSVWRLPGRNSWLSGMQPKMPTPTNSRAEPERPPERSGAFMRKPSRTQWDHIDKLKDEDIDFSDNPEIDESFLTEAF